MNEPAPRDADASPWSELFTTDLAQADAPTHALIGRQRLENAEAVNLVASESYCPRATLQAEASVLVNKNATGYPPRTAFAGGEVIDAIERLAVQRARALFGAEHANVQALSSTVANVAVMRALLQPGDRVLAFDRAAGGHGSHGSARHVSGQDYRFDTFGVRADDGLVDYDEALRKALALRPRMIVAGSSSYPRRIDFARLREIAARVDAMLFADVAHVSGLIVAGEHPNPTPYCDVVTTSTHKTLCGPRTGGLILCLAEHAERIDAALAPGLQAAPGAHIIAARAVLFDLVSREPFRQLMREVVRQAQRLARGLSQAGLRLYAGGTDTHMVVVDLRDTAWREAELNDYLARHRLVANTATLPRRPADRCALGLRLGSTPMAIRALGTPGRDEVSASLATLIGRGPGAAPDPAIAARMRELALAHPIPFG
jgi:glycine hydroxymethyltransferase